MSKNHTIRPAYGKCAKRFVALLEAAGYEFDRVNSKGICFYTHESLPEQRVSARMTEAVLNIETRRLQRLTGVETNGDRSKRDALQVKARQAREREQAAAEYARLEAERGRLVAEREAFAARFGVTTTAEAKAIVEQIERTEREMRYWASLMSETPDTGHRGVEHAKHRA